MNQFPDTQPSPKVFRDMTPEQLFDVIAKEIDDIYAVYYWEERKDEFSVIEFCP